MARSASDATRFTATGPHAYSRASSPATASQAPPNETPTQKVARLREAARRAKLDQESTTWDRVVLSGKKWADRAHKTTVVGLMGIGAISVVLGLWSLGDMMAYNRKKRTAFFQEQQRNYNIMLADAYKAEAEGRLTDDLTMILNKERAVQQMEEEQKTKGGVFKRMRSAVFGTPSREERPGGSLGLASEEVKRAAAARKEAAVTGSGVVMAAEAEAQASIEPPPMEVSDQSWSRAEHPGRRGGPLDQMGQNTASLVSSTTKSWTDWILRR